MTRMKERSNFVNGAVFVATCNRFEAYLDIDEPLLAAPVLAKTQLAEIVAELTEITEEEFSENVDTAVGDDAARHLFEVSSGIRSVVIGEGEITGQVRRSLEQARELGTTSTDLEQLFQRASETAKSVHTHTALGSAGRGLVQLALTMVDTRVTDWSKLRVLLVGTGSYARASLAALRNRGAEDISLYSPSGRGAEFALRRSLNLVSDEALGAELAAADLIVSSTSAEKVFGAALIKQHRQSRKRLLVVDLGMPRNINPDVASLDFVELLDLEVLKKHAPLKELNASHEAHTLIENALEKYRQAAAEKLAAPAITALREHMFGLLDEEIARSKNRGETEATERALRHLVGVLMHQPIIRARALAREGNPEKAAEALNTLFGLTVEQPVAEQRSHLRAVGGSNDAS